MAASVHMRLNVKALRKALLWVLLFPFVVDYTGAALNQIVMIANNGRMPVLLSPTELNSWLASPDNTILENGMMDMRHSVMTRSSRLKFLADIIDLKQSGIWSVGDLLIAVGENMEQAAPYAMFAVLWFKREENTCQNNIAPKTTVIS